MNVRRLRLAIGVLLLMVVAVFGYQVGRAGAYGIPTTGTLSFSGTLLTFGAPDNSTHQMSISMYLNGSTTALCGSTTASSVTCVNGQFTVPVPSTCVPIIHANQNLEVQVTVDNTPLGMSPISAVPYAVEADTASNAAPGSTLASQLAPPPIQQWVITSSETWTSPANSSAATVYEVIALGGGGGGGGTTNSNTAIGMGGGGGGGSQGYVSGVAASTGVVVTVGLGGPGGQNGGSGSTGGTTAIGSPISWSVPGGNGGTGEVTTNSAGATGGLPGNSGALNVQGGQGTGMINPGQFNIWQSGGLPPFGLGASAHTYPGNSGFGAGGGGANIPGLGANNNPGATGSQGLVIIRRLTW